MDMFDDGGKLQQSGHISSSPIPQTSRTPFSNNFEEVSHSAPPPHMLVIF